MESHESDLRDEIHDEEQVRRIQEDYRTAALDPATGSLLDFAVKLTLHPKKMEERDIASLRMVGFDDQTILDAVQTTA